jgi:hypothetical protein
MDYYSEFHEDNFSAWGGGSTPSPCQEDLPEPVENKSRMGQINDLLDERLAQTKALVEAQKMQGGNKLISILNKTIINIDEKLNDLK